MFMYISNTFTSIVFQSLNDISKEAEDILDHASLQKPLVILLDSLDQLDAANNAKSLFWLPTKLPPYVKIIVSTIEEEVGESGDKKEECYEKLKVGHHINLFISIKRLSSLEI